MTIEKAIEYMESIIPKQELEIQNAIRMGIKALEEFDDLMEKMYQKEAEIYSAGKEAV